MKIEKKLSKCLLTLNDNTTDLQAILSALHSFNKRQHLLANQPYISEFENEKEDINNEWKEILSTFKDIKPLYQRTFPDDKEPIGLDKYSEDDFDYLSDDEDFIWGEGVKN